MLKEIQAGSEEYGPYLLTGVELEGLGFEKTILTQGGIKFQIMVTNKGHHPTYINIYDHGTGLKFGSISINQSRVVLDKVPEFVHEIQNLFHGISGKELDIKEVVA